jgi:transposase
MTEKRKINYKGRQPSEIERDRKIISEMYLAGKNQYEIAEEIGVSQATVSRDLKAIQKQWMKQTTFNLDRQKGAELARLDKLEAEYWKSWRDSRTYRKETIRLGNGTTEDILHDVGYGLTGGNSKFLDGVHKCIEQRCKILGLNAPAKKEITGADGEPLIKGYVGFSPDDWEDVESED